MTYFALRCLPPDIQTTNNVFVNLCLMLLLRGLLRSPLDACMMACIINKCIDHMNAVFSAIFPKESRPPLFQSSVNSLKNNCHALIRNTAPFYLILSQPPTEYSVVELCTLIIPVTFSASFHSPSILLESIIGTPPCLVFNGLAHTYSRITLTRIL